MTSLRAFHSDPAIKARYLDRVRAHAAADAFALRLLADGAIWADAEAGLVFGVRWSSTHVRGCLNPAGYVVFTAHGYGERKQLKAHRVVWLAAGFDIPPGLMIDHINRNKYDNRIANLRLADARLNSSNRRCYKGEDNPAAKLTADYASSLRNRYRELRSYRLTANEFGVSRSLVAKIVRGELWTECEGVLT
jgi:HNH endonuclease